MYNNEREEVREYLKGIMQNEIDMLTDKNKEKYKKYMIEFKPVYSLDNNEYFYLVAQNGEKGVYFNDIEESFGIFEKFEKDTYKEGYESNGSLNSVLDRI